jgi:nucleoside-diphosphate-sugar epimerase
MRKAQKILFDLPPDDLAAILRLGGEDWSALRGAAIFLTGGTGFFGKWLLAALACAGEELGLGLRVTVLSRASAAFLGRYPDVARHESIRFQEGNLVDLPAGSTPYDFVIHAATDTLGVVTPAQEAARGQGIVAGTERVLALARASRARRVLNVSSGAVYGAAAGKPDGAREEDYEDARPITAYARAKREAEKLCATSGLDFVTARAFAFLGPHLALDAPYAAGNFLRDAVRGGPILVRGDGTALRSYLHPIDLVTWLLRLLLRGVAGRAYNVGSDEKVTTGELARRIATACDPRPEVIVQSVESPGPQNLYLPNLDRVRAELSLEIGFPLDEAIRRTLGFLKNSALS